MRISLFLLLFVIGLTQALAASRVKDIATLQSVRDNQLLGYGLVIGLQGTGDSLRNSAFTEQSVRAMLESLGIASDGTTRSKNVAAVIVTANLPPFVKAGARIDINVSSLGDATSLAGGTLVMTPLRGPDGDIYAVGQGAVSVSGFYAQGAAETLTQGVPTAGRIPGGAIVEREVEAGLSEQDRFVLQLRNPDFSTSIAVTDAINNYAQNRYGIRVAAEQDSRSINLAKPKNVSAARFFAEIERLLVETDMVARVVMDERSGTVVIGQDVRISTVAISHGTLTVRVTELPEVIQPLPFSRGETEIQDTTVITSEQEGGQVSLIEGSSLQSLVEGLNRLGVKPTDIISILQAIKSAGALQAELVLQ
ncbi:MAG: flagellar basal body P-ring protein FlgI [Rhizobiaceae bacterium]